MGAICFDNKNKHKTPENETNPNKEKVIKKNLLLNEQTHLGLSKSMVVKGNTNINDNFNPSNKLDSPSLQEQKGISKEDNKEKISKEKNDEQLNDNVDNKINDEEKKETNEVKKQNENVKPNEEIKENNDKKTEDVFGSINPVIVDIYNNNNNDTLLPSNSTIKINSQKNTKVSNKYESIKKSNKYYVGNDVEGLILEQEEE